MNYGSSALHIVLEPATDCCRYVCVVDPIEQLLMVHIVEFNCQIVIDEYCSVRRLFSLDDSSNIGGYPRQTPPDKRNSGVTY